MNREDLLVKYGRPTPVLDHGHVTLIDCMGGDVAVVDMARKSYGKGTKATSDDQTLLRYLMRHYHTGPFEGCTIKLHVKCPILVARQLFRHRTGSYDETSLRYSEAPDEYWLPDVVPTQSKDNKQGSGEPLDEAENRLARQNMSEVYAFADGVYRGLLKQEVSREVARAVLPVALYTEYYFVMNLHNLLHLLFLRLHGHAQKETRAFAVVVARILADWVPWTWHAFEDYRLNAMQLTGPEVRALMAALASSSLAVPDVLAQFDPKNRRERDEFAAKLRQLGVTP
jgi:thymidylate synthase (FAD)